MKRRFKGQMCEQVTWDTGLAPGVATLTARADSRCTVLNNMDTYNFQRAGKSRAMLQHFLYTENLPEN